MIDPENFLAHHGVLGMKWGILKIKPNQKKLDRINNTPDRPHAVRNSSITVGAIALTSAGLFIRRKHQIKMSAVLLKKVVTK